MTTKTTHTPNTPAAIPKEDFAHLAKLIRENDNGALKAIMSNNINTILAALDANTAPLDASKMRSADDWHYDYHVRELFSDEREFIKAIQADALASRSQNAERVRKD